MEGWTVGAGARALAVDGVCSSRAYWFDDCWVKRKWARSSLTLVVVDSGAVVGASDEEAAEVPATDLGPDCCRSAV